ncbi:MAG TPA: conjugal transfer protein, partial [Bacillota bacterium]|nr:conjugal transfer protein [Bacillota bacterium]
MNLKRFFGFIIVIFALIGGTNAIANGIHKQGAKLDQLTLNEEAEGFASGFIKTYLTLPAEQTSIKPFTELQDDRPIVLSTTFQDVQGVWVQGSKQDPDTNAVIVNLLVETKTKVKGDPEKHTEEKVFHRYWNVTLQVSRDDKGKLSVTRYPAIHPLLKGKPSAPKLDVADDQAAKAMTPMLESFFKTYLSAEKPEDIANFFSVEADHTLQPLSGKLGFNSISQVDAYGKGPWVVFVNLKVKDPVTE